MTTKRERQAMVLAEEYRALVACGDMVLAQQVERTLDDLGVGSYSGPRNEWMLSPRIRRAMGLPR